MYVARATTLIAGFAVCGVCAGSLWKTERVSTISEPDQHERGKPLKVKQVILIRKDLKMRRGKEIAQGSHASIAFLTTALRDQPGGDPASLRVSLDSASRQWVALGMTKICLRVDSAEQLISCHEAALAAGLKSHLIRDSGRTEFAGVPTLTACAIGPDDAARIDSVTGELTPY